MSSSQAVGRLLALALSLPAAVWADTCFDFGTKVTTALKEGATAKSDTFEQGTRADRAAWATGRGEVLMPIEKVYERLLDHQTTRDPTVTEVRVEPLDPGPNYLARHRLHIIVRILFVEVKWVEDWAYALVEGTPQAPRVVVISYQKTDGSSHLARLCSSTVLRKTDRGTDVSLYQEGRVTGRSPQAMVDFLRTVLRRLRVP